MHEQLRLAAVVGGQDLGVGQALAGLDQRVPGAGSVVAGVLGVQAMVGVGARAARRVVAAAVGAGCLCRPGVGGGGGGQRLQGGLDDCGVLHGAAALDADAAEAVADEGQEPVQVRGALVAVELLLLAGGDPVGVEDLQQLVAQLVQLGGVQGGRVLEEELLAHGA